MTVALGSWGGRWFDAWVEERLAAGCPLANLERHQRAGSRRAHAPSPATTLTHGRSTCTGTDD
ncbi:MAG TPA: hypothetical protein VGR26_07260 [Acidimicrobiales bacterium]|nr:hypothetical protein [Acidimicrobiales bacterium]